MRISNKIYIVICFINIITLYLHYNIYYVIMQY